MEKELKTTYIPGNDYVSKSDAAEWLGIEKTSLQHHIKIGNLSTVRCPTGCHMIIKWQLLEFEKDRKGPGKPTIYSRG